MTVLYFSIIIVLCGAGGNTSFAPQANLVSTEIAMGLAWITLQNNIKLITPGPCIKDYGWNGSFLNTLYLIKGNVNNIEYE